MSDPIEGGGSTIKDAFTKKIGPLPGWAYVVIVGGGAYAIYYWRKRTSDTTASASTVGVTDPNSAGFTSADAVTQADYSTPQTSQTNAQWARNATNALTAQAKYSATDISNALSNYLNGVALSPAQLIIVNDAITQFGAPPEGLIPTNAATVPGNATPADAITGYARSADGSVLYQLWNIGGQPQKKSITLQQYSDLGNPTVTWMGSDQLAQYSSWPGTVEPPVTHAQDGSHFYTVTNSDTLEGIAQRFYGNSDYSKITSANNVSSIYSGQVLRIPA